MSRRTEQPCSLSPRARRPLAHVTRFILALCILAVLGAELRAVMIPVTANVNGAPGAMIGTIDAQSGPAGNTDHLTATFTLAPAFSFLDAWYDFRWVNVEKAYSIGGVGQAIDPVVGVLPAIDPPPTDNPAGFDDGPAPYYYNGQEWGTGMFGTEKIAMEGMFSMFSDSPQDPAGNTITFNTFLVVDDRTDGFAPMTFCVLAGFDWTYTGGTAGMAGEDTSTVGGAIAINAMSVGMINMALGNGAAPFPAWTAMSDCALTACYYPPWIPKLFDVVQPTTFSMSGPPIRIEVSKPSAPTVPIEIVSLSLQSAHPIQVLATDPGGGPGMPGTQVDFQAFYNSTQPLPQQSQHQISLDIFDGTGMNPAQLIEFSPGELFETGFRAGDSFFDIFWRVEIPGTGEPQDWWLHGELSPLLADAGATFGGLTVGGPIPEGQIAPQADSFFDIFVELDLPPGLTFTSGPLFDLRLQAFTPGREGTTIPEPVTASLLLLVSWGLMRRSRRARSS